MASDRKLADGYHRAVNDYVAAVEACGKGRTIVEENAVVRVNLVG